MGIFVYALANFPTFKSDGYVYPAALTGSGWVLAALALLQVPIWAVVSIWKREGSLLDVRFFEISIQLTSRLLVLILDVMEYLADKG